MRVKSQTLIADLLAVRMDRNSVNLRKFSFTGLPVPPLRRVLFFSVIGSSLFINNGMTPGCGDPLAALALNDEDQFVVVSGSEFRNPRLMALSTPRFTDPASAKLMPFPAVECIFTRVGPADKIEKSRSQRAGRCDALFKLKCGSTQDEIPQTAAVVSAAPDKS